jgi:transposase
VRGHENLLKRLLVHAGAFNLGLCMRTLFGIGTPRTLQGRAVALGAVLSTLWSVVHEAVASIWDHRVSPGLLGRSSNDLFTYG